MELMCYNAEKYIQHCIFPFALSIALEFDDFIYVQYYLNKLFTVEQDNNKPKINIFTMHYFTNTGIISLTEV